MDDKSFYNIKKIWVKAYDKFKKTSSEQHVQHDYEIIAA